MPLADIYESRAWSTIVVCPTLIRDLFPHSVYGGNTSILSELAMRAFRNNILSAHSRERHVTTVVKELIDMMKLDEKAQAAGIISFYVFLVSLCRTIISMSYSICTNLFLSFSFLDIVNHVTSQ